ncbi:MAG: hypothetical protein WCK98_07105 [bacterium]
MNFEKKHSQDFAKRVDPFDRKYLISIDSMIQRGEAKQKSSVEFVRSRPTLAEVLEILKSGGIVNDLRLYSDDTERLFVNSETVNAMNIMKGEMETGSKPIKAVYVGSGTDLSATPQI